MRRFNKQFKYREKVRDKGTAAITVVVYTCPRAFIRFVRVSFLDATVPSRHAYFERHANYLRQTLLSYGESYIPLSYLSKNTFLGKN